MGLFRVPFTVRVADIDEAMDPQKPPYEEVARVSRLKAEAVPRNEEDVVIAADTIVVCGGQVLGKPRDEEDALRMLTLLSGRDHQVMTGLTVLRGSRAAVCTEVTDIHFRPLTQKEILTYIRTGEPMDKTGVPIGYLGNWRDKAGGYGIQETFGALAISRIEGDYYNVVGLPVSRLYQILKDLGVIEDR